MQIIEETYNWSGSLSKRTKSTEYIILHHAAAGVCGPQDVHRWHLANGWTGIGYHYFVRKDGTVYRGRPHDTVGAQCEGFNSTAVGICCEGNYMSEIMPDAQKDALVELCREVLVLYPGAKIVGHSDCIPTSCPGVNYPLAEVQKGARGITPVVSEWARESWDKAVKSGKMDGSDPQGPMSREMFAVVLDRCGLL